MDDYIIRKATLADIDFLVEVVIEAEKSGTDKSGLKTFFNLSDVEMKKYLTTIFKEEVDGCELSVSSFLIACSGGRPVGAVAGWIEGSNEDKQYSSVLRSNLWTFVLPKSNLQQTRVWKEVLESLQIDRVLNTLQIEYVYVKSEYRGNGVMHNLIQKHISEGIERDPIIGCAQIQLYANNVIAKKRYEAMGFVKILERESAHEELLKYLPDRKKLLMQKLF